jgi:lactoylglutathione lyase
MWCTAWCDGRTYELSDAWGHLAVECANLEGFWETLQTREAQDYRDPESCDDNDAFTKASDGHEIKW